MTSARVPSWGHGNSHATSGDAMCCSDGWSDAAKRSTERTCGEGVWRDERDSEDGAPTRCE
eukprot:2415651-Prymnesium_polylepis.1